MVKDLLLKTLFIPLLGIGLPLASGIITYHKYSLLELIGANLFFILTSFLIWKGCNWIHIKLRPLYQPISNPFSKIAAVSFVSALYGACTGGLSAIAWLTISREAFGWDGVFRFLMACISAVIIFTLVYEILFLTQEREIDTKIVSQLDRERSQAELQALTNEMDPHFIFNSLNTLNHLIVNEPEQAHLFNNRLAQVYKDFLINKSRQLISLKEELEFIDNYYFLLQLRYDENLQLSKKLEGADENIIKIPPCALQLLLENAIKHNELSSSNRLQVKIEANGRYLKVSNNTKPKPYLVNSTGIGLKNLSSRYMLISKKNIVIENNNQTFTVKLPYIT